MLGRRTKGTLGLALVLLALRASADDVTFENIEPVIYTIHINGQPAGDAVLLRVDGTRLLAPAMDWERWRLVPPPTSYVHQGETYYDLRDAPGFAVAVNAQRQEARLDFAVAAFEPTRMRATPYRRVAPQPPPGLGGFLNYELFATHRAPDDADARSNLSGLAETGIFGRQGAVTSQWLAQNLTDEETPAVAPSGDRRVVRLETAYTRDFPDQMQTLRLGDDIGAAGLWGRPVRFGGVRWHRNFATQPGFVTLPRPSLEGETALPSVLDVYVDGLRRQSFDVPAGPFRVEELPTFTGVGEVQVVVRDLLGREQIFTAPYVAGVQLLRDGLHDYSYEAGALRERFGQESDAYGDPFAAATHRYGFNDAFTGELRIEGSDGMAAAGVGGVIGFPGFGVVSNAFAVSTSEAGTGTLDVLSVQHHSRRGLSLGARLAMASRHFTQLGFTPGLPPPERSFSANAGYFLRPLGRLGLGYVNRDERDALPDFEAVTASLNTSLLRRASLTLIAIQRTRPERELSALLALSVPFGTRDIGSAGYRRSETDSTGASTSQSYARLQRNLPDHEGLGYRVRVSRDDGDGRDEALGAELGVGYNARHGSVGLEAATYDALSTYRATVSGSVGVLGGHTFASRKLTRSFAIVETGAADLELLVNNRLAGRTDADGVAVLPYLQPYHDNRVRIDATNVPLDVEIRSGEFHASPYYRSGVVIPLDVRRSRGAVLELVRADGSPVPPGATARVGGTGPEAPVGRGGQVYVEDLRVGDNRVDVRWNGHGCSVTFTLPADAGVQPALGPYLCD